MQFLLLTKVTKLVIVKINFLKCILREETKPIRSKIKSFYGVVSTSGDHIQTISLNETILKLFWSNHKLPSIIDQMLR